MQLIPFSKPDIKQKDLKRVENTIKKWLVSAWKK